jgi:polyisoprenoid-binding protein YceI
MNRRNAIIGFFLLLIIAGGALIYNQLLGDTLEATGPIQATPVVVESSSQTETSTQETVANPEPSTETAAYPAPAERANAEPEPTEAMAAAAYPAPAEPANAEPEPTEPVAESDSPNTGVAVLAISQADSEVRFSIFEELRGDPVTVVGVSDQVAGEIAVDFSDLSTTEVGPIQINARTLVTDQDRRNQAIRNFILNTDTYEFITFTPTGITGLAGSSSPGDQFSFQIEGNLTIRDITQPVVFDVIAQEVSVDQLTGTATTVINREAYEITIPSVPFVANVGEEVTLEIVFVALAIQ